MSVVTSLVLVYNAIDEEIVKNLKLDEGTAEQRFVNVTEAANEGARGPHRKMLQICLAATAVNYLALDRLTLRIEVMPWRAPESVLLLAHGEGTMRPAVWGFSGALYFRCVDEPHKFVCLLPAVAS